MCEGVCACVRTSHAIVGESFTELIHDYERDAEWVIRSTQFLKDEKKGEGHKQEGAGWSNYIKGHSM